MDENTKEILDKVGEVKNLYTEMEKSQKEYNEALEQKGADQTQEVETKLASLKTDFDAKLKKVETAIARQGSVSAQDVAPMAENLKAINTQMEINGKAPLDQKQFDSARSAMDRYLRNKTSEMTAEDAQTLKHIGVGNGYAIMPDFKSVNTVVDPQGGYFMNTERSSSITEKRFDGHGLFELVGKVNNSTGRYEEIIDWSDYDLAYYKNELDADSGTQDGEDFKLVTWDAKTQGYAKKFTYEALMDIPEVQNHIMSRLLPGAMRQTSALLVNGAVNGKPRGILTYADGSAYGQIQQVESANTGVFNFDDVLTTLPSALKDDYHGNSNFIMKRATFMSLLSAKDGQGKYQIGNQVNFFDGSGFTAGALGLGGYGIRFESAMPAVATGALAVAFGDFQEAYTYVTRSDSSIHRNDSNAFFTEMTLRRRHDGQVKNFEAIKLLKIKA